MKKMQWTTFEGRQYRKVKSREPRVTLGAKSTFYLNVPNHWGQICNLSRSEMQQKPICGV